MRIVCGVIASAVHAGRCLLCGRRVQGLEIDVVLTQQALVAAEALQQLSLGKPTAAAMARGQGRRYALRPGLGAFFARKFAITLQLTLLTELTRKYPLWLRKLGKRARRGRGHFWGTPLWRGQHRRHGCNTDGDTLCWQNMRNS